MACDDFQAILANRTAEANSYPVKPSENSISVFRGGVHERPFLPLQSDIKFFAHAVQLMLRAHAAKI
jgi:hypothetical protein